MFPGVPQRLRIGARFLRTKKREVLRLPPFSDMDMDLFEFAFYNVVDDTSNLSRHLIKFSVLNYSRECI